ncbi:MAG: D-alanine--D-alanine ligase family protein [Chitinophagales bacterium]|nr:D-alanine--D-alanine ligase [Bacteroidota bacterium]
MKKQNIGLVFGGKSPEHEVSIISARNIFNAINKDKFEVQLIGIAQNGNWYLETEANLLDKNCVIGKSNIQLAVVFGESQQKIMRLDTGNFIDVLDVIFPITHGPNGEDGTLQGIFTQLDIPFVGPSVLGSAVSMDKDFTKRILRDAGIGHAKGITVYQHDKDKLSYAEFEKELGKIMFVKPCNMGSSIGVSKVTDEQSFRHAINEAFKFDTKLLVEQAVIGRELECAVLGNETIDVSIFGEVIMDEGIYDFENKYINDNAKIVIPAEHISPTLLQKLQATAKNAYRALGLEGLSRIDVFLTTNEEVIVNEPNTLPGFTSISMYPKLWENSGLSYPDLIERLIQLAIARYNRDKQLSRKRIDK